MTGAEDWISCPLRLMRGLFAESGPGADWERAVTASFQEKLQDNTSANQVPSVNSTPLHYLEPDGLVRFRCMVQDMFDPEFYMGVFETVDSGTNARTLHFGKYRDAVSCAPPQEVDAHSSQNVTCERQTFYCVPIPGEARWAKEAHSALNQVHGRAASTSASRAKRSYEETGPNEEAHAGDHRHKDTKRLETQSRSAQQVPSCAGTAPIDLNFPLPGEKGPACLIKLYENWDNFKVNDAIEVFGVLSVDPHLSDDWDSASMDGMDTAEEQRVHSPPTSLVPRIHAILVRRLQHDNPLMPIDVQESAEGKLFLSSFMSERSAICAGLHGFLTHALLGDSLAAEYLLLHLISTVYARRDVLPLGKFTVNLSGCPPSGTFAETLYRVLQQLVPASYYLPMTIENMNRLRFVPRKDYAANRLVSGVLQLSAHTSLLVDETVLEQGQLDTTGVRNLTALGNLITWQKVDYDFNYHQMEFPCNINVLVASEGRSLLPSDCQVPLRPQTVPSSVEHYVEALLAATLPAQLNQFRVFLSALRFLEYSISDEVTKAVEEDFVDMRRTDPQNMNAEDLHRLLVVARLVSLSAGQTTLCQETWLRAKRLEEQRKGRLQEQKYVSGNEQ